MIEIKRARMRQDTRETDYFFGAHVVISPRDASI